MHISNQNTYQNQYFCPSISTPIKMLRWKLKIRNLRLTVVNKKNVCSWSFLSPPVSHQDLVVGGSCSEGNLFCHIVPWGAWVQQVAVLSRMRICGFLVVPSGKACIQVVVPTPLQNTVLITAHGEVAGHFGVNKIFIGLRKINIRNCIKQVSLQESQNIYS